MNLKNKIAVGLVLMLTLIFSACSSDNNGPDIPTPKVKMYPSEIKRIEIGDNYPETVQFHYDENMKLIKLSKNDYDIDNLSYDEKGRIIHSSRWEVTYVYDELAGTVTINDYPPYNADIKHGVYLDRTEEDHYLFKYEYDTNFNCIKEELYYSLENEELKISEISTTSYHPNYYSPFTSLNLPIWYFDSLDTDIIPHIFNHFNLVSEWKHDMLDTDSYYRDVIEVISHINGYPTEVKLSQRIYAGSPDRVSYYSIKYLE